MFNKSYKYFQIDDTRPRIQLRSAPPDNLSCLYPKHFQGRRFSDFSIRLMSLLVIVRKYVPFFIVLVN